MTILLQIVVLEKQFPFHLVLQIFLFSLTPILILVINSRFKLYMVICFGMFYQHLHSILFGYHIYLINSIHSLSNMIHSFDHSFTMIFKYLYWKILLKIRNLLGEAKIKFSKHRLLLINPLAKPLHPLKVRSLFVAFVIRLVPGKT